MIRPIYEFVLPLFTAHLIGDFLLQSDEDVKNKSHLRVLIKHSFIIGLLSYLLLGILQAWALGLIIFISHAVIDYVKLRQSENNLRVFLIDQVAHILVFVASSFVIISRDLLPFPSLWPQYFGSSYYSASLILSGAIMCVKTGGIVVGFGVKPFLDQLKEIEKEMESETSGKIRNPKARGFEEGGRIIGYLERSLIFLLILANQPTGIGFLIAAKSVFRFGELRESSNRMEAEYILIGTLLSFLYGMLVSYLITMLLTFI